MFREVVIVVGRGSIEAGTGLGEWKEASAVRTC